jgi:hypothetical protein
VFPRASCAEASPGPTRGPARASIAFPGRSWRALAGARCPHLAGRRTPAGTLRERPDDRQQPLDFIEGTPRDPRTSIRPTASLFPRAARSARRGILCGRPSRRRRHPVRLCHSTVDDSLSPGDRPPPRRVGESRSRRRQGRRACTGSLPARGSARRERGRRTRRAAALGRRKVRRRARARRQDLRPAGVGRDADSARVRTRRCESPHLDRLGLGHPLERVRSRTSKCAERGLSSRSPQRPRRGPQGHESTRPGHRPRWHRRCRRQLPAARECGPAGPGPRRHRRRL